ncbi:phage scaffolding protein [Sporosarcina sp. FSL K6-1522]|uniref:phage scaffolding protein n=1 Tax=Sporosarcina sp. FSL K6-1522 TaxID=2921554 RepID=UPI00315B1104
MNREALKEMGLTDEQIDKVMASHGSVVNATKGELTAMTTERDDLKGQLTDRDTQLEELRKIDAEGLQQKITELQSANETTKSEYEEKLHNQAFDFKLQEALTGAKVRNPKALKALLDVEKIKLDGETLLGLDDQLKTLKESDDYLFESGETPPNSPAIVTPGNPNGGENTPDDPFAAKMAKYN